MAQADRVKEYEVAFVAKLLESDAVKRGIEEIGKGVETAKHKAQGFFEDIRKFLPDLGSFNKLLSLAGVSGVLSFGAIVSMMPQAARAFARVQQSVRQFARFLGPKLEPAFNALTTAVDYFLGKLTELEQESGIFSKLATLVSDVVTQFIEWDEKSGFTSDLIKGVSELATKFIDWAKDEGLQKVSGLLKGIWEVVDQLGNAGSIVLGLDWKEPATKVVWGMAGALALAGHPALAVGLLATYGLYKAVEASEAEGYQSFGYQGLEFGSQRLSGKTMAEAHVSAIAAMAEPGRLAKQRWREGDYLGAGYETLAGMGMLAPRLLAAGGGYAMGGLQYFGEELTGFGPREFQPNQQQAINAKFRVVVDDSGRFLDVNVDQSAQNARLSGGG